MSSGLLDFFTLEASEYVEHLDGLVVRAAGGPPELEGFLRNARALRGSATMARVTGIAELATALEHVARALQTGALPWSAALRGACIAAVDDLKILIRAVRTWGEPETARATARAHELAALAPVTPTAATGTPAGTAAGTGPAGGGGEASAATFLVTETSELARLLAAFAENPVGAVAFAPTLQRVRALRGMAVLKDLPPLPEVVDVLDAAAKSFELGGAVTPALRALFATAAEMLAEGARALAGGGHPDTESAALSRFAVAAATFSGASLASDEIVPIGDFFPDEGPGLVTVAPAPPHTAAERFRLDVVTHAEHLRRLVGDAARAADSATRERLGRELGAAAHAVSRMAASFSERALAAFFAAQREQAALLGRTALDALDRACELLAAPNGTSTADIARQLTGDATAREDEAAADARLADARLADARLADARLADAGLADARLADTIVDIATLAPDAPPVDIAAFAPDDMPSLMSTSPATSGDALHALLGEGIAGLSALDDTPLAEPVAFDTDVLVPIEDLVYRGRDALERAIELRDAMREAGGAPDAALLAELFDLLELAATTD